MTGQIPDMAFNLSVTPDCEVNTANTYQCVLQMHSAGARFVSITCSYEFGGGVPGETNAVLPCSVMIEGWKVRPGVARVQ